MGTFLLSAICALTLSTGTIQARPDTTNIYIIDKSRVRDFNGTQLEGKKILFYKIETAPSDTDPNEVLRIHVISTQSSKKVLHVVDNTAYTQEEFENIRKYIQNRIKNIAVYSGVKNQEQYAKTRNIKDLELDDNNILVVYTLKQN